MLAWPNVRHHGLTSDPRAASWWVRRVVRIDFVAWYDVYGRAIRIPEGAPRGALAGARTFASRCIGCHGIRGVGGANGPGLAEGGPFTEPARLGELLAAHPGASAPNLGGLAPERVEELATFLKLISIVPAEEDGEETR
jgi:mono/diheme cytochrome c family protein